MENQETKKENTNDVLERQNAENYITTRLEAERKYYDDGADVYKKEYMSNQTLILIFGAIIPIISTLEISLGECEMFAKWHIGSIVSAVIAAAISVLAGLDKLHQTQSRWNIMRYCAQMLKREEMLYRNRVDDYDGKTDKEAKQLLVKKTEGILYYDIASTLQFSQKGIPSIDGGEEEQTKNN